jgi:hypothetical protein
MIPPPSLRPMKDFNPAEPAVLHDAVNDCIVNCAIIAFQRR